jgi:iron transport multicopper oxidase
MNGTTYIPPVVPTLYTALSAPQNISTDPAIYGPNTNVVVFNNTVGIVEIIINNFDSGAHPFHKHVGCLCCARNSDSWKCRG